MRTTTFDEIRQIIQEEKQVYVNDLSDRFQMSKVSIRKHLARLETEGIAIRFYGGATLIGKSAGERSMAPATIDPKLTSLAVRAREFINDNDSIFIGSGKSCCHLARLLGDVENLTVVTNNITALPDLLKNVNRVYLIGGEVTSVDGTTIFSSWETPQPFPEHIFVKKAFTSTFGLDLRAGLTVQSVISTYIFRQIPSIAHHWYVMANYTKYDRIGIYPVAELNQIGTLITNDIPDEYIERFNTLRIPIVRVSS